MAILATALFSVFYMFPLGLRQLSYSGALMDISFFAKKKLEEIKTYGVVEESSGKEKNLSWEITLETKKPIQNAEVDKLILFIDYKFGKNSIKEEFITYLPADFAKSRD